MAGSSPSGLNGASLGLVGAHPHWPKVGTEPTRDYLWVLAREPELDPTVYRELVKDAERMAFPVDELIEVAQGDACNDWR